MFFNELKTLPDNYFNETIFVYVRRLHSERMREPLNEKPYDAPISSWKTKNRLFQCSLVLYTVEVDVIKNENRARKTSNRDNQLASKHTRVYVPSLCNIGWAKNRASIMGKWKPGYLAGRLRT